MMTVLRSPLMASPSGPGPSRPGPAITFLTKVFSYLFFFLPQGCGTGKRIPRGARLAPATSAPRANAPTSGASKG